MTKTVDQNLGKFVFMYLLATIIPLQFFTQLAVAMFDIFVPIMGRAGSQAPPDVVMAVMCAFVVVVLTSYLVSRYYLNHHMCTELQGLISRCPGYSTEFFLGVCSFKSNKDLWSQISESLHYFVLSVRAYAFLKCF